MQTLQQQIYGIPKHFSLYLISLRALFIYSKFELCYHYVVAIDKIDDSDHILQVRIQILQVTTCAAHSSAPLLSWPCIN